MIKKGILTAILGCSVAMLFLASPAQARKLSYFSHYPVELIAENELDSDATDAANTEESSDVTTTADATNIVNEADSDTDADADVD